MPYKTPRDLISIAINASLVKSLMRWDQILLLGFQAGVYIAFGSMLSILISAMKSDSMEANNTNVGVLISEWPGLQRLVYGAVFPIGLIAVVIVGGELFTSNIAYMLAGYLHGKIGVGDLIRNWTLTYFGNFLGAAFAAYILTYQSELFESKEMYKIHAVAIATGKMRLSWGGAFFRGIAGNWLSGGVAVWQSLACEDIRSKVMAIWWPAFAFMALGYEHCIASMYFGTLGLIYDSERSFLEFLQDNLIPVTLGNIVGGGIFVAFVFWYVYILAPRQSDKKEAEESVKAGNRSEVDVCKKEIRDYSEVDGIFSRVGIVSFKRVDVGDHGILTRKSMPLDSNLDLYGKEDGLPSTSPDTHPKSSTPKLSAQQPLSVSIPSIAEDEGWSEAIRCST